MGHLAVLREGYEHQVSLSNPSPCPSPFLQHQPQPLHLSAAVPLVENRTENALVGKKTR